MNQDQFRWNFEGAKLVNLTKKRRKVLQRRAKWSKSDVYHFETAINEIVESTSHRIAPMHYQFGGFVFSICLLIAATVVVAQSEEVLGGLLMFALGVIIAGVSLWYRTQLMERKWKRIAAELATFFKIQADLHEGMQFEFHIQGHHKKKDTGERTAVWYERYVILTLPPEDYVPRSKRMSFRPAVSKKLSENKTREADRRQRAKMEPSTVVQETAQNYITADGLELPHWWICQADKEGRIYYINNFKKRTQWDPPTEKQIDEEREQMKSSLPPPSYNPETKGKEKFEEVKRRSMVKRRSLIAIQTGDTTGMTEEELLDVKRENRPTGMASAPYSGDSKKTKKKRKEQKERRAKQRAEAEKNREKDEEATEKETERPSKKKKKKKDKSDERGSEKKKKKDKADKAERSEKAPRDSEKKKKKKKKKDKRAHRE